MNAAVLSPVSPVAYAPTRAIALRTRGRKHGPITRLVSPSDIGELIKPFVFLDLFDVDSAAAPRFGWHPHSGIATLTLLLNGGMSYQETTGVQGVLAPGGIEWMRAGDGVWHTGSPVGEGHMKGFQLWVALPPGLENAPAESRYLSARGLAAHGPARVILGSHGPVSSPLPAPPGMNYLDVNLRAHERWTYAPPPGHTVLWLAVHTGRLRMRGIDEPRDSMEEIASGELVVFDESRGPRPRRRKDPADRRGIFFVRQTAAALN